MIYNDGDIVCVKFDKYRHEFRSQMFIIHRLSYVCHPFPIYNDYFLFILLIFVDSGLTFLLINVIQATNEPWY